MSALSQVSSRALAAAQAQAGAFMPGAAVSSGGQGPAPGLAGGSSAGQMKLPALNRMVEVLLYNLPMIQVSGLVHRSACALGSCCRNYIR